MTQALKPSGPPQSLSLDFIAKIKGSLKEPKKNSPDQNGTARALENPALFAEDQQKLARISNRNAVLKKGDGAILPLLRLGKRVGEITGQVGQRFPDGTVEFILSKDKMDPLSSRLTFRVPYTSLIPLPLPEKDPSRDLFREIEGK